MIDREKVIKELESLRDICNAKSNMAIGNGKIAWAGYANTADDAIALLKEQDAKPVKAFKDFEAFVERFTKCRANDGTAYSKLLSDVLELLKSQPQIVRCKDCKHRPTEPDGDADHGSDYIFPDSICPCQCDGDPWYSWMPHDNWFCPKGELR